MEVKTGRNEGNDKWPEQVEIAPPYSRIEPYFKKAHLRNFSKVDVDSYELVNSSIITPYKKFFLSKQAEEAFHLLVANYKWKKIFNPISDKLRKVQNEQLIEIKKSKKWFLENKLYTYSKYFAPSYYPKEVKAHDVVKSISFKLKEGETLTVKNPIIVKELFGKFAELIGELEGENGEKKSIPEPFFESKNYRKFDAKTRVDFLSRVDQILENEIELFSCSKTKDRLVLLGAFLASSGDLVLKHEYEEGNEYKEELKFQQKLKTEYEAYLFAEAREVLRKK